MEDVAAYGTVLIASIVLLGAWWRWWRARPVIVLALLLGWGAWSISTTHVDTDDPPVWFIPLLDVLAIVSVGVAVSTLIWLLRRRTRTGR